MPARPMIRATSIPLTRATNVDFMIYFPFCQTYGYVRTWLTPSKARVNRRRYTIRPGALPVGPEIALAAPAARLPPAAPVTRPPPGAHCDARNRPGYVERSGGSAGWPAPPARHRRSAQGSGGGFSD